MTIDAHQHFWKYNPTKHGWINEQMSTLQRDFMPEDLVEIYAKNGVDGCIAVQADQSEEETMFLLDLSEKHDFIQKVVGWVDLQSANITERLEHFSAYPKLAGFRHVVQDEPDPNFMLKDSFQHGIACLGKHNFTYDILVFPTQLEAAIQLVKKFPSQRFVIDHIAKPYIKKRKINDWSEQISNIAELENVLCKVSGMVTEADWNNWHLTDFMPYLDIVFKAFGTDRIMYGSDWPVCLLAGNYSNIKGLFEEYTQDLSLSEKTKIWGKNALDFYNFKGTHPSWI
jgi:L-fuconolactonase